MKKKTMVEIWGDVVEIQSLIIAIIISVASTMGLFALAPSNDSTRQLFFGLIGAVIGFVVSALLIKPKRVISVEKSKVRGEEDGY